MLVRERNVYQKLSWKSWKLLEILATVSERVPVELEGDYVQQEDRDNTDTFNAIDLRPVHGREVAVKDIPYTRIVAEKGIQAKRVMMLFQPILRHGLRNFVISQPLWFQYQRSELWSATYRWTSLEQYTGLHRLYTPIVYLRGIRIRICFAVPTRFLWLILKMVQERKVKWSGTKMLQ